MSRPPVWAVLVSLVVAACSSASTAGTAPTPRAHVSVTATPALGSLLQRAEVADGATHVWPLSDLTVSGKKVLDLVDRRFAARIVGGVVPVTTGPAPGSVGGRFTGKGRIVTPVPASAVGSGKPFTLEFAFRPDDCTRAWSNVLGTGAYTAHGRQGLNVLHYPRGFQDQCSLAVEFWKDNAYQGGCGTPYVVANGRWELFVLTYDGKLANCWANGKRVGRTSEATWNSTLGTPFGIGGAGTGWAGSLDSGSLADVALYASVLSPARIAAHASALTES